MAPAVRPKRADYTHEFIRMDLGFSYKEIEKTLDDLSKRAMPRAAADVLTNAAFYVKNKLEEHTLKVLDKPNAYTRAAWLVEKANAKDREKMTAAIKARPKQAEYLQWVIFGGTRHKGDAGSGPYDLFAYSAKLTQYGGVDRKYLKKLSKQAKDEKAARKALAARRKAAADNTEMSPKERRKLKWVVASKNKPGIFFGTLYGLKGYWQRSERLTRTARRKTGSPVWTKPGSHPKLLFAVKSEVKSKAIFHYDAVVAEAFLKKANSVEFYKALNERKSLLSKADKL